jgi:hypothetical protein
LINADPSPPIILGGQVEQLALFQTHFTHSPQHHFIPLPVIPPDVSEIHGIQGLNTARIAHFTAAILSQKLRKKDHLAHPLARDDQSITTAEKSIS